MQTMSMEIPSYDNGYRDITSLVKGDALASELDDVRNTLAHNSTKNLDRAVEESTLRLRNYFGDEVLDASHVVSGIAFSVDTVSDNILNEIVELDENELDFSTLCLKRYISQGCQHIGNGIAFCSTTNEIRVIRLQFQ